MARLLAAVTGCGSTVASQVPAAGTAAGDGLSGASSDGRSAPGVGGAAPDGYVGGSSNTVTGSGSGGAMAGTAGGVSGVGGNGPVPAAGGPRSGSGSASGRTAAATGPVRVGIVVAENNAAFAESLGIKGASNGDEPGNARALVKAINAAGGLAGRQIDPRYRLIRVSDASETNTQIYAEVCAHFTEDEPVPVVLVTGVFEDSLGAA